MAGFLPGSRAPLMMDVVATFMLLALPALVAGIRAARLRDYSRHKRLQLTIGAALGIAVLLFEIEVRTVGWRTFASASPYYEGALVPVLVIHVTFASITALAWITVVVHALSGFPRAPRPGPASVWHKRLGWTTAIGTVLTSCTGWIFYWMAFVAG